MSDEPRTITQDAGHGVSYERVVPTWVTCPSCNREQSYHGLPRCAYCGVMEPTLNHFTQGETPVDATPYIPTW
jgi:hypothetical protein